MKRFLILLFTFCLLLSACGKAPAEPAGPAPAAAPEQTSNGHSLETAAEGQAKACSEMDYDQLMEEFYTTLGCFQIKKTDFEQFVQLPPKEAFPFAVHLRNWEDPEFMQEYLAFNAECTAISDKMKEIETACLAGQPPKGYTYGADISEFTWVERSWAADYADVLPLEWFQMQEELTASHGPGNKLFYEGLEKAHLAIAKIFAEAGCKAEVYGNQQIEGGVTYTVSTCFVTATPEQLQNLSQEIDMELLLEPRYEEVKARFDTLLWTSEET